MLAIIILTTLFTDAAPPLGVVSCRPRLLTTSTTDVETLARFERATRDYAALHRQLTREMLLGDETAEGTDEGAENALPEAIRFVRRNAKQGDIFDLEVAELMRFQIWFALWNNRYSTIETFGGRNAPPAGPRLLVNDTLRAHVGQPLTSNMAELLPALPDQLAYRLVGRDLVLFDTRARVIVDVLTNALPAN